MPLPANPPSGPVTLSQNARTVLAKRYLIKDETGKSVEHPEDMFWRVARTIAEADRRYGASDGAVNAAAEAFYALMTQRRFEPNSPTLMNAGRPLGQLSACFVLPVEDALSNGQNGIYDTLRSMALIHQSGGGTGFSFSRLRGKGSMVRSTTGVASGPVSFMKLYDASTDAVKQGGTRRGANMGILRVDHPDILDFIACKEDLTQITNFNISVAVTTEFMTAVKNKAAYALRDPKTGKSVGELDANMVWDKMILGAWRTGEPGCFFVDEANRYNPVPHLGAYEATNPCVIGTTRLATDRGLLTMAELERDVMEIRVVTDDRVQAIGEMTSGGGLAVRVQPGTTLRYAVPVFKTRTNATVFKLVTTHGYTVTATNDHKFFTPTGTVGLKDLAVGDEILLQSGEGAWSTDYVLPATAPTAKSGAHDERGDAQSPRRWSRELGQLLGWVVAAGWTAEEIAAGRTTPDYTVGLRFGSEERELADVFRARLKQWTGMDGTVVDGAGQVQLTYTSPLYYFLRSLGINVAGERPRVPESLWRAPREAVIGFLQAMFSADGTVDVCLENDSHSVRLASSHRPLLEDVQLLLLNLGIVAQLSVRRQAHTEFIPDGHGGDTAYECAAQYELVLYKDNCDRFLLRVGVIAPAQQEKIERQLHATERAGGHEPYITQIESITGAGVEDVYCTTENVTHSIVVNGCVTRNCGEQPLGPYDVCNLGSLNVGFYVRDGVVDWEAMKRDVHLATHFLDNIIDVNKYPLPEIDALSKRIRRIGLGIMGFADLLVRIGVAYDSPEGVEMGREVMRFVEVESKKESERLAKERGPFPEWARSIWGPDETCARDRDGKRVRPMQMLRNCNVTTVAPTGTISIIAGCSSGLEPLFAVAFMRNQAGAMMPDVNEDFVAIARREGWYSEALMERIAKEGTIAFPEVPAKWQRVFVTANQIAPENHIRMQAAFQEYCDSAISKTTNFSHAATVDDVRKIYEFAYATKCKGVTVYRDGSRDNQVLSTGATEKAKAERDAKGDAGDKRQVGELQGTIAELQAETDRVKRALFDAEAENLQRRAKRSRPDTLKGSTRRMETPLGTMYVTITEDDLGQPFEVFITLGKAGGAAMADVEAMGRLISLALRSGIPIMEVHKQLRGIASDRPIGLGPNKVLSVPDAIGIAIEGWWREKQGVQQELIADPKAPPGASAMPVREQVTTTARPQPGAQPQSQPEMLFDPGTSEGFMGTCPDCGSQLEYAEGCVKCHVCGFSECG
ncbi:MAG: hypothetical protein NVS4B3_17820 [Gemmatimonadaceae bacterium]